MSDWQILRSFKTRRIAEPDRTAVIDGLDCAGDGSRMCCPAQARGQEVVAEGELTLVQTMTESYWYLRGAKICEVSTRPKRR
jgi:hypothetical protein